MFYFHEDLINDQPELILYFQEARFFSSAKDKRKIYDLFKYLVKRNYEQEAAHLWDNAILNNYNIKIS